jgi:hypothetical protein
MLRGHVLRIDYIFDTNCDAVERSAPLGRYLVELTGVLKHELGVEIRPSMNRIVSRAYT